MANPEHLEIVRSGSIPLSRWRNRHVDELLDLRDAVLHHVTLDGVSLAPVDLTRASLEGAELTSVDLNDSEMLQTDLEGASLGLVNLSGARMRRASLVGADLVWCNLSKANLTEADLVGTRLLGASLRDTDLSGATFGETTVAECDLSSARGLDSVKKVQPSSIGVDTLALTLAGAGGHFTPALLAFFEHAGVPRSLLDYLPSLLESHPIQFFSCFISYGSDDEEFADRLYGDLKERGVSCYKFDEDALVGRGVWANIDHAIRLHGKTIVICSQSSLQRPAVQREIERALQREDELTSRQAAQSDVKIDTDVLFPVRLDDHVLEGWEHPRKADVIAKNIGDFRGWDEDDANYKRGLEQLLRALDPRSRLGLSKGDPRELQQG